MVDLFTNLGFSSNPFSRFSAEEEKEYLDKIYIRPRYYKTIYNDIRDGASRFIVGERGIGKTALMMNLEKDLKKEQIFPIIIDEYDGIEISNNSSQILLLIIRKLVTKYSVYLLNNKRDARKMSKQDKEKLSFFINNFFETLSPEEYKKTSEIVTRIGKKTLLARLFNIFLLKPTNIVLSGASEWVSTTVSKSLGMPNVPDSFYKSYIPEITVKTVDDKINLNTLDYATIKNLLRLLVELITKYRFVGISVFMDKIDEYQKLGTNVTNIANFIKGIAADTSLLQMEKCSFVFVIWNKIKEELNDCGIRYDKFKPIDINWSNDELEKILNKRLEFFSKNDVIEAKNLFDESSISSLLNLANKSPRQLIVLISRIYDEQEAENANVTKFTLDAQNAGIMEYVCNFDFPSLYPGEKGKKTYIVSVVNTILKVGKSEFGSSDLVLVKKYSVQAANNDLKIMREYALIDEIKGRSGKMKLYRVVNPVINYMISMKVEEMNLAEG